MNRFALVLVALLAFVAGWGGRSVEAHLDRPKARVLQTTTDCFSQAIEAAVPGRTVSPDLQAHAEAHSQAMAQTGFIYHTGWNPARGPEYETSTFTSAEFRSGWPAGTNYPVMGENVGTGPDCSSVQAAFEASAGHRANIDDSRFKLYGVGVYIDSSGQLWVTEDFAEPVAPPKSVAPLPRPAPTPPVPVARPSPRNSCGV